MSCIKIKHTKAYIVILFLIGSLGCRKSEPSNPYTDATSIVENHNPSVNNIPEGNFAWLHAKIFKPTCANSGCHDGSFEPEFRSVNSAYNSLVNHPVISNNEQETFVYRVVPGNAAQSLLHERLTVEIPNTSGMMPLSIDPGSDWNENKNFYIEKITQWINDGAKDMYGNPPPAANSDPTPTVLGLAIFPQSNTSTPYPREQGSPYGIGAIQVPASIVDVWILCMDNEVYNPVFSAASLKYSISTQNFDGSPEVNFSYTPSPIFAQSFFQTPGPFYYKATLNLTGAIPGTTYYLRCYLDDGAQPTLTEVPSNQSEPFWYLLFSIKIV